MAIIVTYLDIGQWVVEASEPELDWVKLISSHCCWESNRVVQAALAKGLIDFVLVTKQICQVIEADEQDEVTGP